MRPPIPALIAAVAALAASAAVLTPEIGSLGGDNAEYVLLSRSLAEEGAYRSTWAPGEAPPHTQYPPVYPLLLAPFTAAAPASFLAAHVPALLASGVAAFLLALLFARRGLHPWAAAAAALAPALSLHWLRCAADLLSDLPFLAFAAGALLALDPGEEERLPPRRVAAAAVCTALAFLTRTAGLALVLPVLGALLLDRRGRGRAARIGAAALGAAVLGWTLHGALHGAGGGYLDQLLAGEGGLPARAWRGLTGLYLPGTPAFLFPRPGGGWTAAGWALWALAAAGLALGLRRRRLGAVPEAFLLLYLAMQSAWPFVDPRFALPLAALLPAFALEGTLALAARAAGPARGAAAATALGALLLLPNLHFLATRLLPRAFRERPALAAGSHEPAGFVESWAWSDAQYAAAAPSLAAFLHACDVLRHDREGLFPPGPVLATNPRVAALLTGRRALQAPAGAAPADLEATARAAGVALLLVDNFAGENAAALRRWRDGPGRERPPLLRLPGGVEVHALR